MSQQPVGDIIDQLGVTAPLNEGDLVGSAVVVLSLFVEGQTQPRLAIACSDGMSWIEQAGLLRLAEKVTSDMPSEVSE